MKKQLKNFIPVALRFLIGAAVLVFLLRKSDFRSLTIVWDTRTTAGLVLAVGIIAAAQVCSALRWKFLLGNDDGLPFGYLLRVYVIGFFFGLFLPTSVGGDAVRAAAVTKGARRPGWVVSSIVLERALGLVAMMGLLALGGVLAPEVLRNALQRTTVDIHVSLTMAIVGGLTLLALGLLAVRVLSRSARLAAVLRDGWALWASGLKRPRAFAAAFAMSFVVQGAYLLAWYQLALALRLPVPAAAFLVLVPFTSVAAMLPVTISGLGLREGAWVLLLAAYGVTSADAVAYSLLYFAAFVAVGLVGGIVFATSGLARQRAGAPAPLTTGVAPRPHQPETANLATTT